MFTVFNAVRAAILFGNSRENLAKKQYQKAAEQINRAISLLGERIERRNLYYVPLRAAEIYFRTEQLDKARNYLETARKLIACNGKLNLLDRDYILDYCDLLSEDIEKDTGTSTLRVSVQQYDLVSKRYLDEYKINWSQ